MQVRTLDPSIRVSGKDLELWALPAGGVPTSLGLVGGAERSMVKLAGAADKSLANVPALAVSLEPKGGSPTGRATGPVLAVGPCVKFW
jgi:anti-sigma-K factor RskA